MEQPFRFRSDGLGLFRLGMLGSGGEEDGAFLPSIAGDSGGEAGDNGAPDELPLAMVNMI